MAKRMLADVIWDAANEHLAADGDFSRAVSEHGCVFSCHAIEKAATGVVPDGFNKEDDQSPLWRFVNSFRPSFVPLLDFENGIARQGVRYMWLLLAMHVAEDEGIEA